MRRRRRAFFFAMTLQALCAVLFAGEVPMYLGTYSKEGKDQGILRASLDVSTGKLSAPVVVADALNPSFLAIPPDGKFLFAATEHGESTVRSYRIGGDGGLDFLNERSSGGAGACHVVCATGHVVVSNYGGGTISVIPFGADGLLGEPSATVAFEGSGPNRARQEKPHAHAAGISPDGKFLYACDLGTDRIWSFRFDAVSGRLTPTDPPAGIAPPGGGPRHLAIHPEKPFLYSNNEMGLSVTVYSRDLERGGLNPVQTIPVLPEGTATEKDSTSEMELHPSGRWLYVSNRVHNSITVFEVMPDGRLRFVENVPSGVAIPRGFAIAPGGGWLVIAGQKDGGLASFKIDGETGRLSAASRVETNAVLASVVFSPRSEGAK